ncbi:helix-turn-helix protein [Aureibacillus halotolerans]|uniref:Helix-turn-helix protein n=2 Tax=Aureibacillus halotolerans TaxID=1508390 RepID=A0A4R6TPL2_9BACI|nr:helix-turn-helix protein [Aureibacillus halotolerans]
MKALREQSGITQRMLANQIGIDVTSLRNVEENNQSVNVELLGEISNALSISMDELLHTHVKDELLQGLQRVMLEYSSAKT